MIMITIPCNLGKSMAMMANAKHESMAMSQNMTIETL
jgi:hypothetical protein